jgi:phosphonate transport system permease protein
LPAITIHTLFRLEWNVRAAAVIGMIGAGGIGGALFNSQQLFFYRETMAWILVTWLLVAAVDFAGSRVRRRLGEA